MVRLIRSEFLSTLKLVEAALGPTNSVPQFSRFWFDGDNVSAFNDDVGISAALKTEFTGGVDGMTLLKLLGSSRAADVEIDTATDKMSLRMARARSTLSMNDISYKIWSLPKVSGEPLRVDLEALAAALDHCMLSVGSLPSIPESLGITFVAKKKALSLYSTTNTALSKAEVQLKAPAPFDRLTVHKGFCSLLISLVNKKKHSMELRLTKEQSLLTCKEFGVFGRLMSTTKPVDFEREISDVTKEGPDLIPIPSRLSDMLKRSLILASNNKISLTVGAGKKGQVMTIHARSDMGEMRDSTQFDHPSIDVLVDPNDIQLGCKNMKAMSITNNGVLMVDEEKGKTYAVCTIQGR